MHVFEGGEEGEELIQLLIGGFSHVKWHISQSNILKLSSFSETNSFYRAMLDFPFQIVLADHMKMLVVPTIPLLGHSERFLIS